MCQQRVQSTLVLEGLEGVWQWLQIQIILLYYFFLEDIWVCDIILHVNWANKLHLTIQTLYQSVNIVAVRVGACSEYCSHNNKTNKFVIFIANKLLIFLSMDLQVLICNILF